PSRLCTKAVAPAAGLIPAVLCDSAARQFPGGASLTAVNTDRLAGIVAVSAPLRAISGSWPRKKRGNCTRRQDLNLQPPHHTRDATHLACRQRGALSAELRREARITRRCR